MRHSGAEIFTSRTIPGQRSSAVHTPLSSGSSSCILRILKQCTNSRLYTWSARAFPRIRREAKLGGIQTQQPNCSPILWRLYDAVVKIPKPAPRSVLPSSHSCQKPSELPRWRICGKSGTANFHCLLCISTPRGWSPPICFTFLSVLFMEHKYYMTISKIKGANFRLEA